MPDANDLLRQFPSEEWSELEGILKEFESAWQSGERPNLDDYLRQSPMANPLALVELVHLDLEYRLKLGEAARVESYLARYPDLDSVAGAVVDLVAAEYEL